MTNSIRKMLADGSAKRADAVQIRYEDIHIEPGFNLRDEDDDYEESIQELTAHIAAGGRFPPLEVRLRDEGGVWVVDGHRRHASIGRALAQGAQLRNPKDGQAWIHVVHFDGNDAARTVRIITSAKGKPLSQLKIAEGYKRLISFGWSIADIAKEVTKSQEHVRQMLLLGNANSDVQQLVRSGEVSPTVAVKAASKHGEKAGAVLASELAKAKEAGKARVTSIELSDRKIIEFMQKKWFTIDAEGVMTYTGPNTFGVCSGVRVAIKALASKSSAST